MIRSILILFAFVSLHTALESAEKPNFVLIFTDDLGYGDLGSFGSTTIRTPHLARGTAHGVLPETGRHAQRRPLSHLDKRTPP